MGVVVGIAQSKRGRVSGLMIELFSVPADFGAHLPIEARGKLSDLVVARLGSAIGNSEGFKIEYGQTGNLQRVAADNAVNLWLIASSYGADGVLKLVYQEPEVRLKAGEVESFVVNVPETDPSGPSTNEPPSKPEDIERGQLARRELTGAFVKASQLTYADRAGRRQSFQDSVAGGLLADLSTVVRGPDGSAQDEDYLEPGAPVRAAAESRIKADLEKRFQVDAPNPLELQGRLSLTAAQVDAIRQRGTLNTVDGTYEIAEEDVHTILSEGGGGLNPGLGQASLARAEVVQTICRPPSHAEQCLAAANADAPPDGGGGTNGSGGSSADASAHPFNSTSADELRARLPGYVSSLLNERTMLDAGAAKLRRPGEQLTEEEIRKQASFPSLSLPPGPADTAALYDFHKLQIAFKPLWTEALDSSLLADAEAVYNHYVELGGDINALGVGAGWGHFIAVMGTVVSISNPPPASVSGCIEVTAEEWNILPAEYRARLVGIADKIVALQDRIQTGQIGGHIFWDGLDNDDREVFESVVKFVGTQSRPVAGRGRSARPFRQDRTRAAGGCGGTRSRPPDPH